MNENVRVTGLDNGVRVVTETMPHLQTASLGIWVGTGARNEAEREHGISHLLEHMAFKGTHRRSAIEIAEEIEQVGGDLNAMTGHEITAYYARVLAPDAPLALDILADILTGSVFDAEELRREQNVIVQEIGAANDTPDDIVHDLFQEAAFHDQTLGRSILGTPQSVCAFTRVDLDAYLQAHYRGPGMVVAAAGAVDHDAIVEQAARVLADIPATAPQPPSPGAFTGGERRDLRDIDQANLVLGFAAPALADPDFYVGRVAAGVLGGGMSSRLFQEIREKRGLCYSIYAFTMAFSDTGLFAISAATGESDLPDLMELTIAEILRAGDGVSEREVDRARAQLKASILMSHESPSSRAGQLARQLLMLGRVVPGAEIIERIEAVTPDEVCRFIADMVRRQQPALAAVGPIAELDRVAEIAKTLQARPVA
ncbi:MAG: insulinase family protein [Rhodobiaceae bacterium]|nr:insulinase family protein [Rhodobiaceae bacterium]MCC0015922.1 insulinase family protein [Rhodobiaceae bacterium]MCC0040707.1 insulinase family protein [Rhodobiaceae bacterium]